MSTNIQYLAGLLSLRIVREYLDSCSNNPQNLNDKVFIVFDKLKFPNMELLPIFSDEVRKILSLFLDKKVDLFLSLKDFEKYKSKYYDESDLKQKSETQSITSIENELVSQDIINRKQQRLIALTHPRCALLLDIGDVLTEKVRAEEDIEYEKIDDGVINILRKLIENGVPIGFATGKPLAEVDRTFNRYREDKMPSIAESAYVYSAGSTVVRLPYCLDNKIIINSLSEKTVLAINDILDRFKSLGLERARIYKHKSDLQTFTENRRDFELHGGLPTRINITALCGDNPVDPNCTRTDKTDSRFETVFILQNIIKQYPESNCLFRVAGRIGIDISAVGKGWANLHFNQELCLMFSQKAKELLTKHEAELNIDSAGRVLKIIDLYALGKGADSDFIDSYSFSIGQDDRCYEYEKMLQ